MKKREKLFNYLLILTIIISVFLAGWHLYLKDLMFHSDIARDFLLIEDIILTKKPTLIGARAGGIDGVFHGPLWLYLNLPAFFIANGNPVGIGWFWLFLSIISLGIIYFVTKKVADKTTALIAAAIYSTHTIIFTRYLINPFGAVILSPIFFYLTIKYLKKQNIKYVFLNALVIGLVIHFQIAYGLPLFILFSGIVIYTSVKEKVHKNILGLSGILIPLVTYIAFEFRHSFLQTNAIFAHISKASEGINNLSITINDRLYNTLFKGLSIFVDDRLAFLGGVISILLIYYSLKKFTKKENQTVYLFLYYYLGFWLISLLQPGKIPGYYYWPFLPLLIIVISTILAKLDKRITYFLISTVILLNVVFGLQNTILHKSFFGVHEASWLSLKGVGEKIYSQDENSFGYFIYTPDQFGYAPRYAMNYLQQKYPNISVAPHTKSEATYLIYAPAPPDKPYLNGISWKTDKIKITRDPDETFLLPGGYKVEKYLLTEEEIKIQPDPNIITDLHFR